ncbi:MAG TPA: translesion DNA synthesis-associated protein ImuA [Gammaproteobacteria bacterium]|nr:translesion DNA synthesis-associated protein ImuA [Gammaproteobacteria bacterium]
MDFKMTTFKDSVARLETDIGKAFSEVNHNKRATPRARVNKLLHSNPNLWRGCDMAGQGFHGISTGYPELDGILPGRGWPQSGLVEIVSRHWGMGELQLLIPLMRSIIEQGKWILLIAPPYILYAPALTQAGIDIHQILIVKQDTSCKDALWSMEKAMQTKNCGLVLAWQNWLPGRVLRRLQLAAETSGTLGMLFKHNDSKHSPSPLRLQIKGSAPEDSSFAAAEVTVIKARGNFRPLSTQLDLYQDSLSA